MKILGWIASILALIIILIALMVALFDLGTTGYAAFFWGMASIVGLLVFIFAVNPAIRATSALGNLKRAPSAIIAVFALVFWLSCTVETFDIRDHDNDETTSSDKTSAKPTELTPVKLGFFECGLTVDNDRRLIDATNQFKSYDTNKLTVFGITVSFAETSTKPSTYSRFVQFSDGTTIDQVANAINAKLGQSACLIDGKGANRYCVVDNRSINESETNRKKIKVKTFSDKTVSLGCVDD
jgi:hypothetical protein